MNRLNLTAVAAKMAARVSTVTANVVDFQVLSPTLAKVVATFNTLEATREDLHDAVCAAMKNTAMPVRNSFRALSSYGNPAMVGFVALNRETKPFTEAAAAKMTALASNMLMDAVDDSLWEVRSDGAGGKMLCRQQDGDAMRGLLETARVRAPRAPKLENVMAGVDAGNFTAFIDPATDSLRFGYVLATDLEITAPPVSGIDLDAVGNEAVEIIPLDSIVDNESDELTGEGNRVAERLVEDQAPVIVPASLLVECAELNGSDRVAEVAAPSNVFNKQAMLDYYKQMYSYAPDYYNKLAAIINNHAGF